MRAIPLLLPRRARSRRCCKRGEPSPPLGTSGIPLKGERVRVHSNELCRVAAELSPDAVSETLYEPARGGGHGDRRDRPGGERQACLEIYTLLIAAGLELSYAGHVRFTELCQCTRSRELECGTEIASVDLEIQTFPPSLKPGANAHSCA